MVIRQLEHIITEKLYKGKAIVLLGARQTGKTTLLRKITASKKDVLFLDGDDHSIQDLLEHANTENLRQIAGRHKIIFIDEAQRIKNIGLIAKIIIDQIKPEQVLISGSSALEFANEINEPLTGRKWEHYLYPISWHEWQEHIGYIPAIQQLEQRLIYGFYPDVLNHKGDEIEILKQLSSGYLYKDLLTYKGIKKPEMLIKLLKALALQIGNEVSYNKLSRLIQIDKNTVQHYIDLLEKAFVIFRLEPLSRNLRTEISTNRKIYFYDNGIRNALINSFNPLDIRNDTGALWENFLISERKKYLEYNRIFTNIYFWRTKKQQEIDYVEERNGAFYAYEFKWNPNAKARFPKNFTDNYNVAETKIIHRDNFINTFLQVD